jgi:hypothetical protein
VSAFLAGVGIQLMIDAVVWAVSLAAIRILGLAAPWGAWAFGFAAWAAGLGALSGFWPSCGPMAVAHMLAAAFCAWMWWRKPGNRKRVTDAIGAKARSLLDALLDRLRETLQSRPGLQPVPAGAGAVFKISAMKGWH